MRYHAYDEAPDYLRGEVAAQRRYERQKSNHPLCNDPGHPGCQSCEPEMFPETVPEGYMTRAEFIELITKQVASFDQNFDGKPTCEAGWWDALTDWISGQEACKAGRSCPDNASPAFVSGYGSQYEAEQASAKTSEVRYGN